MPRNDAPEPWTDAEVEELVALARQQRDMLVELSSVNLELNRRVTDIVKNSAEIAGLYAGARREMTDALGVAPGEDPVTHARRMRDVVRGIQRVTCCDDGEVFAVELLEHKNAAAMKVYKMLGIDTIGLYTAADVDARLLEVAARIERLKVAEEIVAKVSPATVAVEGGGG